MNVEKWLADFANIYEAEFPAEAANARNALRVVQALRAQTSGSPPLRTAWDAASVEERAELVQLVLDLPLDRPEWNDIKWPWPTTVGSIAEVLSASSNTECRPTRSVD